MKTVGKQLQEARLAKNWTPELAARETKIKVDRLRDLEGDDYSHFTSPTYARGFVRTYARALGLDEYRILRQLDNKLPDDDSANIVTDNSGVAYLPETAMPPRVAHRNFTGLYVVMGLGAVVSLAIVVVLFQAYRVGELSRYFGNDQETTTASPSTTSTNAATGSTNSDGEALKRALPIDSSTPPPLVEASAVTNVLPETGTNAPTDIAASTNSPMAPRAMPVNPSAVVVSASTNAANPVPVAAPRALPVNADPASDAPVADTTNQSASATPPAPIAPVKTPPRALPVNAADLAAATDQPPASATTNSLIALNTLAPAPVNPPPRPKVHSSLSARGSNSGPVVEPSLPPVAPSPDAVPTTIIPTAVPVSPVDGAPQASAPAASPSDSEKRLVLTASQDSFVRVTKLDGPDADKPLYASVLHSGQSVGFDGRKFSINVGVPSAVDIKLDGVNYGPHSDQDAPETFTVQSHLP